MAITLWIQVVLMALSGFYYSSETRRFSLSKIQPGQMRRDSDPSLGPIEHLLSQPGRSIVTILIGNEFVNVTASVMSAAIVIRLLGTESKFITLYIMISILLLFGNITPKTPGIRNNVAFANLLGQLIEFFAISIKTLHRIMRPVADSIMTVIIGKQRIRANIVTEDMLRTLARDAVGEGVIAPARQNIAITSSILAIRR